MITDVFRVSLKHDWIVSFELSHSVTFLPNSWVFIGFSLGVCVCASPYSLLLVDQDVSFQLFLPPYLCSTLNNLISSNLSPIKDFLLWVALIMMLYNSNKKVTNTITKYINATWIIVEISPDRSTTQLIHLRLKNHCRRKGKTLQDVERTGSCLWGYVS